MMGWKTWLAGLARHPLLVLGAVLTLALAVTRWRLGRAQDALAQQDVEQAKEDLKAAVELATEEAQARQVEREALAREDAAEKARQDEAAERATDAAQDRRSVLSKYQKKGKP